ncbi:unnamed protein product [Aphanomyces euteiches]
MVRTTCRSARCERFAKVDGLCLEHFRAADATQERPIISLWFGDAKAENSRSTNDLKSKAAARTLVAKAAALATEDALSAPWMAAQRQRKLEANAVPTAAAFAANRQDAERFQELMACVSATIESSSIQPNSCDVMGSNACNSIAMHAKVKTLSERRIGVTDNVTL